MLRRTTTVAVFMPSLGPMKGEGVPNNQNIDELIRFVKQSKKLRQYFGSHFHRVPDRDAYYSQFGGPRGGKFTIRRVYTKRQFYHHTAGHNRYTITHTNPKHMWSGLGAFGTYRNIWDNQQVGSNGFWDVTFKPHAKNLSKDKAIEWMESWGVKYHLFDEVSTPHMMDMVYVKHRLYSHNFPWIKDPYTNPMRGDADWQWKGADKIDYSAYGAATPSVGNEFRSLWGVKDTAYVAPRIEPPRALPKKSATVKPEAPKAQPKVETVKPQAETPKTEAPKAEPPKAEAPKADAPKAEAPKAEAPKPVSPKVAEAAPATPAADASKPPSA